VAWLDGPLEGRALHTSPSHRISIYLLERYIPKNVFFLCEEVLIYDAPESATFPRMFSSSARRF
jgi:hypothetical protein